MSELDDVLFPGDEVGALRARLPERPPLGDGRELRAPRPSHEPVDPLFAMAGRRVPISPGRLAAAEAGAVLATGLGDGGNPMVGGLGAVSRTANPIAAWHGSPREFDRFVPRHIGRRDPAMYEREAGPHAFHFTETPEQATAYADLFADRSMPGEALGRLAELHGAPDALDTFGQVSRLGHRFDPMLSAYSVLTQRYPLPGGARVEPSPRGWNPRTMPPEMRAELARLVETGETADAMSRQPGHVYEVRLHAEPHQLLPWDRPLREADPRAVKRLEDIMPVIDDLTGADNYRHYIDFLGDNSDELVPGASANPTFRELNRATAEDFHSVGLRGFTRNAGANDPLLQPREWDIFKPDPIEIIRRMRSSSMDRAAGGLVGDDRQAGL